MSATFSDSVLKIRTTWYNITQLYILHCSIFMCFIWFSNKYRLFICTGLSTVSLCDMWSLLSVPKKMNIYTGCPRRNGQNFGRVFLMLNYTDITQNTYIQSWTVTEIMAIEKCGLLGCPRTVSRPWRHTHPLPMPGNEKPLADIGMQWPWRDKRSAAACVKCLVTLRTTMTWMRVFL